MPQRRARRRVLVYARRMCFRIHLYVYMCIWQRMYVPMGTDGGAIIVLPIRMHRYVYMLRTYIFLPSKSMRSKRI